MQGRFGADCDDGVLLADLARNALIDAERVPPAAERFRVSIHHCPSCQDTRVGDPQAPSAPEHTDMACAECDAEVLDLMAPKLRMTHAIPPATRRKVFEQHGHRCAVPHGRNRLWLDLHHVRPRSLGGDHRAGNLICLCSAHHRLIHEGPLALVVDPDTQRLRFVLPTGEALGDPPQGTIDDIATHVGRTLESQPGATGRALTGGAGLVATALDTLRARGPAVRCGRWASCRTRPVMSPTPIADLPSADPTGHDMPEAIAAGTTVTALAPSARHGSILHA